ncbi:protein kinase [[Kitasatospora] papulosa]|uniref:protein kinase domain-containing protein n=1 Tax=[Kitasatospora] papulosa TaxID=1464011 RepID=UPI0036C29F30
MGRREQPLGPGGGPVREFAEELRRLRQEAGSPSYEAMARRVLYGRATLHAAARGNSLPSKDVALAFVRACGGDDRAVRKWAQRWETARTQLERDLEEDTQPAEQTGEEEPATADRPAGTGERGPAAGGGTRQETMRPLGPNDPRQVGGFTLLCFLGSGAMGRVYLGESLGGRRVAIKVIDGARSGNEEFRARFRQEIAAARRVQGMFTAAVVAADPDAEDPWLATEYVAGPSLQEVINDQGPLPAHTVIRLAAGIAEALAAIHGADVVHRDLKPGNVLVARDGPKVIDFGIARTRDATTLTRTQMLVGTPGYVAPERLTKGKAGPACDVFSLGALLAFAATGRLPFGSEPSEISYRIVHGEPDLEPVPEGLRELVARCLAKDPDERPTPREVLDWCCERAGQPGPGWLPAPLTGVIRQRAREAAEIRVPDTEADVDVYGRGHQRTQVVLAMLAVVAVIALVGMLLSWQPPSGDPSAGPSISMSPTGGPSAGPTGGATAAGTAGTATSSTGGTPDPTSGATNGNSGGIPTGGSSIAGGAAQGATAGPSSGSTQGAVAGSVAGKTAGPAGGKTAGASEGPSGTSTGPSGASEGPSGTSNGPSAGVSAGSGEQQNPILGGTSVYVQPRSDSADCTKPITFTFAASAQRTGTIHYTWYPDQRLTDRGYKPRTGSMTFATPNTQYETFEVQLQGTQSGEVVQGQMAVEVTSPERDHQRVGDQFYLTCT